MFGVIFFWVQYIVAAILLYLIIFKTYKKSLVNKKYTKTENDERCKYPLWFILTGVLVYFIPLFNIILFITFIVCYYDEENLYSKSFLTKEY